MQRFIADPDKMVDDTVRDFVKAHRDFVRLREANQRVVVSTVAVGMKPRQHHTEETLTPALSGS